MSKSSIDVCVDVCIYLRECARMHTHHTRMHVLCERGKRTFASCPFTHGANTYQTKGIPQGGPCDGEAKEQTLNVRAPWGSTSPWDDCIHTQLLAFGAVSYCASGSPSGRTQDPKLSWHLQKYNPVFLPRDAVWLRLIRVPIDLHFACTLEVVRGPDSRVRLPGPDPTLPLISWVTLASYGTSLSASLTHLKYGVLVKI